MRRKYKNETAFKSVGLWRWNYIGENDLDGVDDADGDEEDDVTFCWMVGGMVGGGGGGRGGGGGGGGGGGRGGGGVE